MAPGLPPSPPPLTGPLAPAPGLLPASPKPDCCLPPRSSWTPGELFPPDPPPFCLPPDPLGLPPALPEPNVAEPGLLPLDP